MLRRNVQLLTLTLLSSAALGVPRAEAAPLIIDNFDGTAGALGSPTALSATDGTIKNNDPSSLGNLVVTDTNVAGVTAVVTWNHAATNLSFDDNADDNYFELDVTSFTGDWMATLTIDGVPVPKAIVAPIPLVFKYSDFGNAAFFESIDQISLMLTTPDVPNDNVTIASLTAVPEPGTASLLTLGLFGLAAGSPRRRVAA
jgi:hypothetical protein